MKKLQSSSDLKFISLNKMVNMLNEVADSKKGTITIESEGFISIPMTIYSKNNGCDWRISINRKVIDEMIYEQFIIIDYTMNESPFSFDTLEIIGDILYDESLNQFKISFELNFEIVISVIDYEFKGL
jgi:hypothetical protein